MNDTELLMCPMKFIALKSGKSFKCDRIGIK